MDLVEQFVNLSGLRKSLHESVLRRVPDFVSIGLKVKDKRAQLVDLYKCYLGVKEIRKAATMMAEEDVTSELMNQSFALPLEKKCSSLAKFCELVESTLDFNAVNEGKYLVNPNFDNDLQELRAKLDDVKDGIDRSLNKMASSVGLDKKNVKLENTAQHGYVFRVTMKDEKGKGDGASSAGTLKRCRL